MLRPPILPPTRKSKRVSRLAPLPHTTTVVAIPPTALKPLSFSLSPIQVHESGDYDKAVAVEQHEKQQQELSRNALGEASSFHNLR